MVRNAIFLALAATLLTACGSDSGSKSEPEGDVAALDQGGDDTATPDPDLAPDPDLDTEPDSPADTAEEDNFVKGCQDGLCVADDKNAPDPSAPGPFPVGVKTFTFTHQGHQGKWRKIIVEVWYPATEEARDAPKEAIDLKEFAPDDVKPIFDNTVVTQIPTNSVRDAQFRTSDGPYPLIIFSHGAFGIRFQNVFYTELLASHGYVVVSPDHADNTLYDLLRNGGYDGSIVAKSALDRPYDIVHLLDKMFEKNSDSADFFFGSFNEDLIGITGHSFGGMVSFLSPMQDSRFKAAVPMTPATQALGPMGYDISKFPIPVMVMSGTKDNTLETDVEMAKPFEILPSPKYYFELLTGGHYTYTDICSLELKRLAEDIAFGDAEDALNDGCGENNVPVSVAHPLINQFAIGFFNHYLRSSTDSYKYFSAEEGAKYSDILLYIASPLP